MSAGEEKRQSAHYPVFKALLHPPEKYGLPMFMVNTFAMSFAVVIMVAQWLIGVKAWVVVCPLWIMLYITSRAIHQRDPHLFRILHQRFIRLKYSVTYAYWRCDCYGTQPRRRK